MKSKGSIHQATVRNFRKMNTNAEEAKVGVTRLLLKGYARLNE